MQEIGIIIAGVIIFFILVGLVSFVMHMIEEHEGCGVVVAVIFVLLLIIAGLGLGLGLDWL